jgi:hypothetical protein
MLCYTVWYGYWRGAYGLWRWRTKDNRGGGGYNEGCRELHVGLRVDFAVLRTARPNNIEGSKEGANGREFILGVLSETWATRIKPFVNAGSPVLTALRAKTAPSYSCLRRRSISSQDQTHTTPMPGAVKRGPTTDCETKSAPTTDWATEGHHDAANHWAMPGEWACRRTRKVSMAQATSAVPMYVCMHIQ